MANIQKLFQDGVTAFRAHDMARAEALLGKVVRRDRRHAPARGFLSCVAVAKGAVAYDAAKYEQALSDFEFAKSLTPDNPEPHFNEALTRLLIGDFERGWDAYEWRIKLDPALKVSRFVEPRWHGHEAIDGKSILLYTEQGLGDAIQFCRYVSLLAERGARVTLAAEPALMELFKTLPAEIIAKGSRLTQDFDYHCPLLSLPRAFGTRADTIPSVVPYLKPPTAPRWQVTGKRKIGLAWAGSATNGNDKNRSIPLLMLMPLLDSGATFISLQKELRDGDVALMDGRIIDCRNLLTDFAETAALISQLDLVITVDTAVAHLAGALGKPVWILLPYQPDWRWQLDRGDSPWYPTARLFRQSKARVWAEVIANVRAAL